VVTVLSTGVARVDELVGRQREMTSLRGWLQAALEGRPRLVLCGGEPGIGKTRLAHELAAHAETGRVPVVWARAPEGVAPPPFWLWHQLMRSDREPGSAPGLFPEHDPDLGLDPGGERFTFFDAVTRRLFGEAAGTGLVLVIDDVQWADQPSLLLLRHLARELRRCRLMVLATHRTVGAGGSAGWQAVLPDLVREPVTEQIHLRGLSLAETARCVAAFTGDTLAEAVGAEVHRLSQGNPFFVRELGRAQVATGGAGIALPESVLDVVAQRIGRLPPAAGRLLAVASVLGEQFPVTIAASLADRPVVACLELLEESAAAGLLEPARTAGDWRFTHALVRHAVEARISVLERVRLHREAALAIEATYASQLDARLADLARHWAAVAVTGERAGALHWATKAAKAAMDALAYEEGARLYRLALDAGGPDVDDETRGPLLLDLAAALWQSAELDECHAVCREVATLARTTGRPELLGRAALTIEPIGTLSWDLDIRRWCQESLAGLDQSGLDQSDLALRARLLARLSEASVYLGEVTTVVETSGQALELADRSEDVTAIMAALRARQLALSGPEHLGARTVLADRMIETGLALRRPVIEMWGRLWRIDTHWERGDLAAVAAALGRLAWCVGQVGGPLARWHLLVVRAALAQACGRFSEAIELGREAYDSVRAVRHPAAFGAYMSLLGSISHHIGPDRVTVSPADPAGLPGDLEEVRSAIFGHVAPALALAESGRLEEAAVAYRGAGPVGAWAPPPYFHVLAWAVGSLVAVALGEREDVGFFYERLRAERGRHAVGGAGNASYFGPVELHLGRAAAFLGRFEDADAALSAAAVCCRAIGAAGFAVEADCELAAMLAQRGGEGDGPRALSLAAGAEDAASRLGMDPWAQRAAELVAMHTPLDARGRSRGTAQAGCHPGNGPLSPREAEVAVLVADGRTNREIASTLFVSERTAQTHVQHILTKLGFSNRSQIASWVWRRPDPGPVSSNT